MTDRPILFSAPMVRALLDGRKTQTRRLIKPQPETFTIEATGLPCNVGCMQVEGERVNRIWLGSDNAGVLTSQVINYAVGDRLCVKETWRSTERWDHHAPSKIPVGYMPVEYLATPSLEREMGRTRVSIFMPRWASRLTLTVTDVRVERLQDISEVDAIAEGIAREGEFWRDYEMPSTQCCVLPVDSYRTLWDSINGADAWEQNPWVVALTFDVRKGNIDQ